MLSKPLLRLLASALLLLSAATALSAADDYVKSIEKWRAERVAELTTVDSWLTLIGRHELSHGRHTLGSAAGNDIRLAAGPGRLGVITYAEDGRVTLDLADGVGAKIDGTEARSAELIYQSEKPTYVRFGTANFYILSRDGKLYVRVRDSESPHRKNFAGIDYFPIDPAWRIEAQWVPFNPPHQTNITYTAGQTLPAPVPGKAVFTHEGHTIELIPIGDNGDLLFFVISDQTSGIETYGASRFVYASMPKSGEKVILDFNQAHNPPCVFTVFSVCPLPPKENRMPFPIRAGEKIYRDGPH
ncbi:MAG: DUF1684 domain-containing protein [Opitutae bacterium]|nr:DUF1684 domain-containing protein [Opitutae bacterium]